MLNLRSAQSLPSKPKFIPKGRATGTKALGLGYERKVFKAVQKGFPEAKHGQWFLYFSEREEGPAWCQTDILLPYNKAVYILECKLSDRAEAKEKLFDLYIPVVEKAMGCKAYGIVVTKFLKPTSDVDLVTSSLRRAIDMAFGGNIPTLHWLGLAPIW